jgi:Zn-dependent protease
MKWSFKLGRFLGIDVHIHLTFLLLLAFIGATHWMAGQTLAAAFTGVLFFVLLFVCVLLHEYGHALMARRFGIGTRDITLLPFGGVAHLEKMPRKPSQELWVALAGPAVNVVIAIVLAAWLTLTGTWEPISALGPTEGNMIERLLAVNVGLVMFNMLPAFPMDGGRVLHALLAMKLDYTRATSIAATVGKCMAVVFAILGLMGNPMLMIIAFFVWMGATQEAGAVRMKSSFNGVTVREAMLTDFMSLTPTATLGDVSRLILAGSQQDFPVVENGRVVGMLLSEDIFAAIKVHPADTSVEQVMRTEFDTLEEGEMLDEALGQLRHEEGLTVPVMRKGVISGLLTAENLSELHLLRSATSEHHGYSHYTIRFSIKPNINPRNAASHS